MFERFTERARQVVVFGQDEARLLAHDYLGTEHLLLGLLREDEGIAARVLDGLDITLEEVRAQVVRVVGEGSSTAASGMMPFTPAAKKTLELSLREARSLGHDYIDTEHVLLGLIRVEDGVAARILRDFDADADTVRNEVIRALGPGRGAGREEPSAPFHGIAEPRPAERPSPIPLIAAIVLAAVGFPLGLLVGYLIWS